MRKPFIVEFTGTPEAGKTTVINQLYAVLSNKGYKVKLYPESAELSKSLFPKGVKDAKLWININTLQNIIEAPFQTEYDIILFDRGSMDRLFWIYMDSITDFNFALKNCSMGSLFQEYPPDLLMIFKVSPEEALKRRGGEGHLVTNDFLMDYNRRLNIFINSIGINKVIVSTDNHRIYEVVNVTLNSILENMNEP